jgi:hypothetical protein
MHGDPGKDTAHQESREISADQHFMALLETSSLGTPAARRIQSSVPSDVVEDVRRRRAERHPLPPAAPQAGTGPDVGQDEADPETSRGRSRPAIAGTRWPRWGIFESNLVEDVLRRLAERHPLPPAAPQAGTGPDKAGPETSQGRSRPAIAGTKRPDVVEDVLRVVAARAEATASQAGIGPDVGQDKAGPETRQGRSRPTIAGTKRPDVIEDVLRVAAAVRRAAARAERAEATTAQAGTGPGARQDKAGPETSQGRSRPAEAIAAERRQAPAQPRRPPHSPTCQCGVCRAG